MEELTIDRVTVSSYDQCENWQSPEVGPPGKLLDWNERLTASHQTDQCTRLRWRGIDDTSTK